jgi:hypothetical protein
MMVVVASVVVRHITHAGENKGPDFGLLGSYCKIFKKFKRVQ